jgi:methionyl-tRNA formyltransferase
MATGLRLAFMGSPDFAVPALQGLAAQHQVAAVYCQPPKPAGRGMAETRCPVHQAALDLGLPVRTPARLKRDETAWADFAALNLDVAVVTAYGLILPPAMLAAPRRGCLNIHASLLPRWRGASPIQAAILAGDAESGITIMRMDAGLDTGPMLLAEPVALSPRETGATLHDRLAPIGARLILRALDEAPPAHPQPEDATHCGKLARADGRLDWAQHAAQLDRQVRAFDPWPGTFCLLDQAPLKVLAAEPAEGHGPPGTVLDEALTVACGQGALRLLRVQAPGRRAMDAADFLRGKDLPPGSLLG